MLHQLLLHQPTAVVPTAVILWNYKSFYQFRHKCLFEEEEKHVSLINRNHENSQQLLMIHKTSWQLKTTLGDMGDNGDMDDVVDVGDMSGIDDIGDMSVIGDMGDMDHMKW